MKKYISKTSIIAILSLSPIFFACTNDVMTLNEVINEYNTKTSHYIDYEDALAIAIDFMSSDSALTRSTKSFSVADHSLYYSQRDTRSVTDSISACFHVINFSEGGFAVVAADDRTTPVYAYSDEGYIDIEDAIRHTGFAEFMESATARYLNDISTSSGSKVPRDRFDPNPDYNSWITHLPKEYYNGHEYYVDESFMPIGYKAQMLSTAWGQKDPFNYETPVCPFSYVPEYCGKYPAGCGPVALAQILAYHETPTIYIDTYGVHDFPWSDIKSQSTYSVGDYSHNILLAAHLITQIQSYAPSYYSSTELLTTTYISDIQNILSYFNCTGSAVYTGGFGYPNCPLQQSLDNNMPIYARGTNVYESFGHAWVIDGYRYEQKIIRYYETTYPYNLAYTIPNLIYRPYYHCNWGWNGQYNAYCLGFSSDGTLDNQFGFNNKFILNIHPISGND